MIIAPLKYIARRDFIRVCFGLHLSLYPISAQSSATSGTMTKVGNKVDFSVTNIRPLTEVARMFTDSFKVQVTFEEAPNEHPDDVVDVTVREVAGRRSYRVRGGPLAFSFELTGEGDEPNDTRAALEAAVSAYHDNKYPGRYAVETEGNYFHIVPRSRKNMSGILEELQSPLDYILHEEPKGRRLDIVFDHIIESIRASSPFEVKVASNPFRRGEPPDVSQQLSGLSGRAALRILLDDLNAFYLKFGLPARQRTWVLLYSKGMSSYYLTIQ